MHDDAKVSGKRWKELGQKQFYFEEEEQINQISKPDDYLVADCSTCFPSLRFWDLQTKQRVARFEAPLISEIPIKVSPPVFFDEDSMAVKSSDGRLIIWRIS